MKTLPLLIALSSVLVLSCAYRPARFQDAPPVTQVEDDFPIPLPRAREYHEDGYLSDVYFRRALVGLLEPQRTPEGGDVNSIDEVPGSSWYEPNRALQRVEGPPVPPLSVRDAPPLILRDGIQITDSRGRAFELRLDPVDRPGMRTGAAAISSRLVRAFGLYSPEVSVVHLKPQAFKAADRGKSSAFFQSGPAPEAKGFRAAATRWPVGRDAGVSPAYGTRRNDPNDAVPHEHRRTLRALKVLGAWLSIGNITPQKTRDSYIGMPPDGYLRHYVVGLEDSLGAGGVVRPGARRGLRTDLAGGPGTSLLTLGLRRGEDPPLTQTTWLSIGALDDNVPLEGYQASPPFAPMANILPGDGYWAAKRIATITLSDVEKAVRAAQWDATATREMVRLLRTRQQKTIGYWLGRVTPVEVQSTSQSEVVFEDLEASLGHARADSSRYSVRLMRSDGWELARGEQTGQLGEPLRVKIPEELVGVDQRVVVRVVVHREGRESAPPCHAEFLRDKKGLRLLGIRH